MCHLPESAIKPVSPALIGGFFTTEAPGKPETFNLKIFWRRLPGVIYLHFKQQRVAPLTFRRSIYGHHGPCRTAVPNHISHDLCHEGIYPVCLKFSMIHSCLSCPWGIGSRTCRGCQNSRLAKTQSQPYISVVTHLWTQSAADCVVLYVQSTLEQNEFALCQSTKHMEVFQ